jgi:Flp pilus assembly protein TadG
MTRAAPPAPEPQPERGAAATELVLIAPVLISMLLLVALGGRPLLAGGDVEGASRDAARAASLERDRGAAVAAARKAAEASLADRGITCVRLEAPLAPTTNFRPGGTVTVDVSCDVSLASLSLIRVPGRQTVSATATEVIDVYRGAG